MAITIDQIKSLRAVTGISMQACKKALEENGGDEEKAIQYLRKRGEAKAVDRAARTAGEGVVAVATHGNKVAMVMVFCETDFSARSTDFVNFAQSAARRIAESPDGHVDFSKDLIGLSSKIGEKIEMSEPYIDTDVNIGTYVHTNRKLGAYVGLGGGSQELARDIAMHVTASQPRTIKPEEVEQSAVDKEREIWIEELKKQNKPEKIWENILKGKEKKFREEQALLTQPFVKNPDITVGQYIAQMGPGVEVHNIMRMSI